MATASTCHTSEMRKMLLQSLPLLAMIDRVDAPLLQEYLKENYVRKKQVSHSKKKRKNKSFEEMSPEMQDQVEILWHEKRYEKDLAIQLVNELGSEAGS